VYQVGINKRNSSSLLTHTVLQGSNIRENEQLLHAGQCHVPQNDCSRCGIWWSVDKSWIMIFYISVFQELQMLSGGHYRK